MNRLARSSSSHPSFDIFSFVSLASSHARRSRARRLLSPPRLARLQRPRQRQRWSTAPRSRFKITTPVGTSSNPSTRFRSRSFPPASRALAGAGARDILSTSEHELDLVLLPHVALECEHERVIIVTVVVLARRTQRRARERFESSNGASSLKSSVPTCVVPFGRAR